MDIKRFVVSLVALAGLAVGTGSSVASGQAHPVAGPQHTDPPKSAPTTVPAAVGQEVVLKQGQEAKVVTQDLTVRYTRLLNDSRCPENARCIWAGDAAVEILLTEPGRGESTKAELHTGLGDARQEARFAARHIELVDVSRDGNQVTLKVS